MTAKFRFESLLRIREAEQAEKKEEFLAAQSRLQAARNEFATLERRLRAAQEEAKASRAAGTLDVGALRRRQAYRAALVERLDETARFVQELKNEAEIKRGELNDAIRETKILQKLKEKQENERLEIERRRGQKIADETATRQKIFERQKEKRDDEIDD